MALCPICQYVSDVTVNCDAIKCPTHGVITGLFVYENRDLPPEQFMKKLEQSRKEQRSG